MNEVEREDEAPARSARRVGWWTRIRTSPVTTAIAVLNVLVFLWAESQGDTTSVATLLRFGAIEPLHVRAGEYWRLGTYMFLHIGWVHLIWNTWASVSWSAQLEAVLGKRRFLLVYLLAGIGGGAVSVVLSPAVSAGASGAMFGIVGATLVIRYRQLDGFAAFAADPAVRSTFFNIALWTVIGLTALSMNHYAHFGGLAVGAIVTGIVTAERRALPWAVFGVGFSALLLAATEPWLLLAGAR